MTKEAARAKQPMNDQPLKFHWRLTFSGEGETATWESKCSIEDGGAYLDGRTEFCRKAEEAGMDSLLTDFGYGKPDPMLIAAILGQKTEKIKFILAYRSGLFAPTMFTQQLNTLSSLINGRLSLNIVAGYSPDEQKAYGDFLSHDERYERTEEFLAICHAFWRRDGDVNFQGKHYRVENGRLKVPYVAPDRTFPEIFIGGGSDQARKLALSQGTCWMRLPEAPQAMRESIAPVLASGIEVGLRFAVVARPTRDEALSRAREMAEGADKAREYVKTSIGKMDSVSFKKLYEIGGNEEWLTPLLWAGAARIYGPAAITLVGSAEEVASALMDYKRLGVSQFILSGWPKLEEMINFGRIVLPIVREMEREAAVSA